MWSFIRLGLVAGSLGFLIQGSGWLLESARGKLTGDDALLALILVGLCFNIYFLLFRTAKGDDWLALWMKRKKLEEEKRILELEQRGP